MASTALGTGFPIPIDYSSRDYLSLRSDLLNAVPNFLPEWTSTSTSDLGVALLELFAYVGDVENYYIDRIANEAFLPTAQQRTSVLNLAYLIDYQPQDATPGSAGLTLVIRPNAGNFVLPMGTQFSTPATPTQPSIIFETDEDHSLSNTSPTASASVSVNVVQGSTVANENVGSTSLNSAAGQTYTLFNRGVIASSVLAYVNEGGPTSGNSIAAGLAGSNYKPWTQVGHLTDAGPTDSVYMLAEDANGVFYVIFGDGSNGRIPNPGSPIQATYRVGGGVIGNVGAQQITVDLSGTDYFSSVSNPNPATGGADPETLDQIRVNAPKSLTAAGRCVSLSDYSSVAMTVPGVSKASAVATAGMAVNLYVHPAGGPYKAADLSSLVTAMAPTLTWGGAGPVSATGTSGYLDDKKMVGWSITVLPPQIGAGVGYVQIVLTMNVQVLPVYTNLQVQQDVLTAVNQLFDFGSMEFGQRLTLSSVYHAIQAVPGVDYLTVSSFYRSDGVAGVGDIVCQPYEIPVVGNPDTGVNEITVNVTGGL